MRPSDAGDPTPDFTVNVTKATLVPELDAVREFVAQLRAEFEADPALVHEFEASPDRFLGDRGLNADARQEWLAELGVAGAGDGCFILSCVWTEGCLITDPSWEDIVITL